MKTPIGNPKFLRTIGWFAVLASAGMGIGCGTGSFDPRIVQSRVPAELNILQLDSTPTLVSDSAGFWAVRGQDRSVEMFYADSLGQAAERVLRFEVEHDGLDKHPDGTGFRGSDSVFIIVRITDPATLSFDFEPSGLRFKKDHAKLTIWYGRAANQPSLVGPHPSGGDDDDNENAFGIWMQEQANGSFIKLKSRVSAVLQEVEAEVPGFSRYAVAF